MKELDFDFVDVSELNLSFKLKKKVPFDAGKSTLVTYLEELKEFDKKYVPMPIKIAKVLIYSLGLATFFFFSLLFYLAAFSDILKVFQNTYYSSGDNIFFVLGIPELFIPPIAISSSLLAGSLMLLAGMYLIIALLAGVFKSWTSYHEQMLVLSKKLQEMGLLEDFFDYQEQAKSFHLKEMSINWEMEWIYPFFFDNFPPYLQEIGEITLYVFTLISFPLPILLAIITSNLVLLAVFTAIPLSILFMGFQASKRFIQAYQSFKNVQKILIARQQEKLLLLMFKENVDQLLVHVNQENLKRLASEKSIPMAFPLIPLSILLPVFSTLIGYVILALENA
jgi:hypothetical protein